MSENRTFSLSSKDGFMRVLNHDPLGERCTELIQINEKDDNTTATKN